MKNLHCTINWLQALRWQIVGLRRIWLNRKLMKISLSTDTPMVKKIVAKTFALADLKQWRGASGDHCDYTLLWIGPHLQDMKGWDMDDVASKCGMENGKGTGQSGCRMELIS